MKKTNFLKSTMMLLSTSLLLTVFTSCSEKEDFGVTKMPDTPTELETKGCPGPPIGVTWVSLTAEQWTFVDDSDGSFTFHVSQVSSIYNAVRIKTMVNNTTVTDHGIFYLDPIDALDIPASGPNNIRWFAGKNCGIIGTISNMVSRSPIGVFIELLKLPTAKKAN